MMKRDKLKSDAEKLRLVAEYANDQIMLRLWREDAWQRGFKAAMGQVSHRIETLNA